MRVGGRGKTIPDRAHNSKINFHLQNDYIHIHSMLAGSQRCLFFHALWLCVTVSVCDCMGVCVCDCVLLLCLCRCYRFSYTRMNFYSICKATTSCTMAVLNTQPTNDPTKRRGGGAKSPTGGRGEEGEGSE